MYMLVLFKVIESIEKMGEELNLFFEKLCQVIDNDVVVKMVLVEFNDIQMEFSDGIEQY